jgi:hypothetical protein
MALPAVAGDLETGFHKAVDENVGRQLVVVPFKSYR